MEISIPFFPYSDIYTSDRNDLLSIIDSVSSSGSFILQNELEEFESSLAKFLGCKYAVGVGNATDGLMLLLRAAGILPGDEVLFCSHTMTATAAAIHFVGAIPVPTECGPDRLIDISSAEAFLTEKTKAIVPTQLNGRTANMNDLKAFATQHNLLIIEDAAQALGAKFNGQSAGTFDIGGAISFYPAKVLGCLGDGGAVVTNSDEIYHKVKLLHNHGKDDNGDTLGWGINSRLDNIQAAILSYKLKDYDEVIIRRREIARLYNERLKNIKELSLPPGPENSGLHFDIFQNYEIEADNRDTLREYLKQNGIETIVQWGGEAVHQIKTLNFDVRLPYTESFFERCLLLPINLSITDDDVLYICKCIRDFFKN